MANTTNSPFRMYLLVCRFAAPVDSVQGPIRHCRARGENSMGIFSKEKAVRRLTFAVSVLTFFVVLSHSAWAQRPARPSNSGPNPESRTPVENVPLAKDDEEKRILEAIQQARQGPRYANVSETDGRLLRLLTETSGAKLVVEIGTSTGESGLWFAMALCKTGGRLVTHEIDPGRAKIAADNFKKAGVERLITIVLGNAHEKVKDIEGPIDILFLDADKNAYLDYLDKLVPKLRPGGLIIAHNIVSPAADPKYLDAITKNPEFETSFLLMDAAGISVTMKKR
jgi:caffeoyl-CoA O-methyltransferase